MLCDYRIKQKREYGDISLKQYLEYSRTDPLPTENNRQNLGQTLNDHQKDYGLFSKCMSFCA